MPDTVDLAAAAGPRRAQVAWWDRAHAPKVTWAERREELTLVVHIPRPKDAKVQVEPRLVTFTVTDATGRTYNVDLPLKKEVDHTPYSWTQEIGSTSVRVKLKKTKASKGMWQDEVKRGTGTGNNTCLSVDPKKSKNWLAYDWEVYKEDEEDELEDEPYEEPDDEPIHQLPAAGELTEEELRAQREREQDEREDELRREAEALRAQSARAPKAKAQMLQFTFAQLKVLMGCVGLFSVLVTFLFTRAYYLAPPPACAAP
eukprot:TRINITY_DN50459_c0_g1_i1.p2 TRINITY_DN50459_c0_g1~~TRINITY_DN50459_c0_g1_i1.p2  ORF type:complete len:286 (+),score=88.72 TRINITY_DN50459_c0_g1_i1:87-860(+)